jgi:hypothetical protein
LQLGRLLESSQSARNSAYKSVFISYEVEKGLNGVIRNFIWEQKREEISDCTLSNVDGYLSGMTQGT